MCTERQRDKLAYRNSCVNKNHIYGLVYRRFVPDGSVGGIAGEAGQVGAGVAPGQLRNLNSEREKFARKLMRIRKLGELKCYF